MSDPVSKRSKMDKTAGRSSISGPALVVREPLTWQIINYDIVHRNENLADSEHLKFGVVPIGPDFPSSKWMFYLRTANYPGDGEKKVGVFLRLVQPKETTSEAEKNLFCTFSIRIEKEDGSIFVNRMAELKSIDFFRNNELGVVLFNASLNAADLPLHQLSSLFLHAVFKIYSRDVSYFADAQTAGVTKANQNLRRASYLESGDGADVTIHASDGTQLKAHKALLMFESPVFRTMFLSSGMQEQMTGVVHVTDLSGQALKLLLRFIYTGDVLPFGVYGDGGEAGSDASKPCISEVLYGAAKYQLLDLLTHIDQTIGGLCKEENAKFLLHLANKFGLQKAQQKIMKFIMRRPIIVESILRDI